MAGSEDWLMRPILRGMCKYESLKNCRVDLYDIDLMNEAIDIEEENRHRIAEAIERNGK